MSWGSTCGLYAAWLHLLRHLHYTQMHSWRSWNDLGQSYGIQIPVIPSELLHPPIFMFAGITAGIISSRRIVIGLYTSTAIPFSCMEERKTLYYENG